MVEAVFELSTHVKDVAFISTCTFIELRKMLYMCLEKYVEFFVAFSRTSRLL